MRRISLAVALLGAVAAAGCGGSGNSSGTTSNRGTPGSTFTVTVRQPTGGTIRSGYMNGSTFTANNLIICGTAGTLCAADFPWDPSLANSVVALQATADTGKIIEGWAGDCTGSAALCVLSGNADKFVLARFSAPDAIAGHPNWEPAVAGTQVHVTAMRTFAFQCNKCHGLNWTGVGIAPSCYGCHNLDTLTVADPVTATTQGPHFDAAGFGGHATTTCGRCHTSSGFLDWLGVDGSQPNYLGTVNAIDATPTAGPFTCKTCHNGVSDPYYGTLDQRRFVSGKIVSTDGISALCSQCHDGSRPGYEVATLKAVLDANYAATTNLDAQATFKYDKNTGNIVAGNGIVRAHYLPAAATLFGGDASAWAEYSGNIYTKRNEHGGVANCTFCHDPHTGQLPADSQIASKCGTCHFSETTGLAVASFAELEESRQFGFEGDIDGDGTSESLSLEYQGLGAKLFAAIQAYATRVSGTDICIADNAAYVYSGGACTTTAYNKFTPRLQKAVFNYLMFQNDPGAWAHNPRYAIEVIYDSIADLNLGLGANYVANGKRAFNGHFGAAEDPSPYAAMIYHGGSNALTGEVLPTMGFTSAACYQCHGGQGGFNAYLATAPAALTNDAMVNKVNAMQCDTCHTFNGTTMKGIRADVGTVYFPPQKAGASTAGQVSFTAAQLPPGFTVCATCHSGRENGASITAKIGTTSNSSWSLSFTNPHYLGAAGMMMGSKAAVMYQYPGKTYTTDPAFWSTTANGPHGSPHGASCSSCHAPKGSKHTFEINTATTVPPGTYQGAPNTRACDACHTQSQYGDYRLAPKALEFEEAAQFLYTTIRAYAQDPVNLASIQTAVNGAKFGGGTTGQPAVTLTGSTVTGVCYDGSANPYFFLEVSGTCMSVGDATHTAMSFGKFNPKLLKAAFNYQWTQKEPGAWAHNEYYVLQVIYDSIVDLGSTPPFTVSASTTNTALNRP